MTNMASVNEQRAHIASLLDTNSPADAPTSYYALYHNPSRSNLFVKYNDEKRAIGFVGRFQTGVDLFRPVIVMRCWQPEVAADLMAEAFALNAFYFAIAVFVFLKLLESARRIGSLLQTGE